MRSVRPRSSEVRFATPSSPCSSEHGLWKFWFGYIESVEVGDHDETKKNRRSCQPQDPGLHAEQLGRRWRSFDASLKIVQFVESHVVCPCLLLLRVTSGSWWVLFPLWKRATALMEHEAFAASLLQASSSRRFRLFAANGLKNW